LEALGVFGLALAGFAYLGFSWWLFAALILAPDLSGIGYVGGTRLGAWCYDFAHTYVVPGLLGMLGFVLHEPWLMALASIWIAHISFDRVIGYGLKFSGNARDTHLARVG